MAVPRFERLTRRHVSALWVGRPLGPYERLCLTSFVHHGFEVDLYAYEPLKDLPAGVRWQQADQVLPASAVFENPREPGTFAAFANRFRYRLLQVSDTVWIDADVLCLSGGLPDVPFLFGRETAEHVNSAVLAAPSESAFLEYLVAAADEMDPQRIRWGQMGPLLVTEAVARHGLEEWIRPESDFYPVHFDDVWQLFDPQSADVVAERVANSLCMHWWNEFLRRASPGLLEQTPPPGSYMAEAFTHHGVSFPSTATPIDADWVRTVWRHAREPRMTPVARAKRRVRRAFRALADAR